MLAVGTKAPDFTVSAHDGTSVSLRSLLGKRVVLYFYPKADTPGCTKQGCGFRDRIRDFEAKDIVVLGTSFDTAKDNLAFANKFTFPFRLLCDTDRKLAVAYGAAASTKDAYPRRITYVIGKGGAIEQAIDTKDPGAQAAAILAIVEDG